MPASTALVDANNAPLGTAANPLAVSTQAGGPAVTGAPFSAGAVATLFTTQTNGYQALSVQLAGTFVATVVYEVSNDGTNWVAIAGDTAGNTGTSAGSTSDTAPAIRHFLAMDTWFRARVSAWTSGTVVCTPVFTSGMLPRTSTNAILAAGTANIGLVTATCSSTSGAGSVSAGVNAAGANSAVVRNAACTLTSLDLWNGDTVAMWAKVFDKATAAVLGTDTPKLNIFIPAGGRASFDCGTAGIKFAAGVVVAFTQGAGLLDATALTNANTSGWSHASF